MLKVSMILSFVTECDFVSLGLFSRVQAGARCCMWGSE